MASAWMREDQAARAAARILDAAGRAFAEHGVQATTMAEVARRAGCSRATVYNHFPDRRALEVAFVHRRALDLAAAVGERTAVLRDPGERTTEAFLAAVELVRSDEALATWFTAPDVGVATEISADSEVVRAVAEAFTGSVVSELGEDDVVRRGRWLVRMVVSLLSMPEPDALEERRFVEEVVTPALIGPGSTERDARPARSGILSG